MFPVFRPGEGGPIVFTRIRRGFAADTIGGGINFVFGLAPPSRDFIRCMPALVDDVLFREQQTIRANSGFF